MSFWRNIDQRTLKAFLWIAQALLSGLVVAVVVLGASRSCVGGFSVGLSVELWSAPCRDFAEDRVWTWLHERKRSIHREAGRFRIDERAISGAIAYEALKNVHLGTFFGLTRSAGPGKVHYKEHFLSEGMPAAKEVEIAGVLPELTIESRRAVLETDEGAIKYIAAIMSAQAAIADRYGMRIRRQPAMLVTLYTTRDLPDTALLMGDVARHRPLQPSDAGSWVSDHLLILNSLTR